MKRRKRTRRNRRRPQVIPVLLLLACGALAFVVAMPLGACRKTGGPSATPGATPMPRRVAAAARAAPRPMPQPVRAVWIARFHYLYPDDVVTMIDNCARIGCNTVLWQVRGEGTVSYPSRIEPWSREFKFQDPGYDPLQLAIREAHARGLRLEAWVNVMPGWKGKTPPPVAEQLYHEHPDWFLHDGAGRQQPLGDFYVILNPCLPEVRRHITSVIQEIATHYDVDGVHLDYVRFAWDGVKNAKNTYPRDGRTLALYERETGLTPDQDPSAWLHWRANQVTRLVGEIRQTVARARPGATLTAAVWNNPGAGYWDFLQNSVAWANAGLVDALYPMAYNERAADFEADIAEYQHAAPGRRIIPGIGLYKLKSPGAVRDQLAACRAWGGDFALFSYESLFPTAGDRTTVTATGGAPAEEQRLRYLRRDVLADTLGQG